MIRNPFRASLATTKETAMSDPKFPLYTSVGTGGGGGTHISADFSALIGNRSPQAQQFVLITILSALAEYASNIRDLNPGAFKSASAAIAAGTDKLRQMFEPGKE
jgi:hypothetical protein